jgi:hypothetical protein
MAWQELTVYVLVVAAALYVGRRAWRTWSGRGTACASGCGKGCGEPKNEERPTFIPAGELTLRRR